jgi:ParB/RepB/Spo0J family partition protein
MEIPMTDIHADVDFNCRGDIAPIDVIDLAKDIAERGLIQPITIAPYSEEDQKKTGYKYKLIAGFRRYTAHRVNKNTKIDCIVREDMVDPIEATFFNLSENIQRKDLNILQEAKALQKLHSIGVTETDAAERLGKSRGWIQVRYLLLNLPDVIQQEVAAGIITQTQIRELYSVLIKEGKDECITTCKRLKEAKERGQRTPVTANPHRLKKDVKKQRNRAEMFLMLNHLADTVGFGLHTRMVAWCAGEITTGEAFDEIKAYADEHGTVNGLPYKIPDKLGD